MAIGGDELGALAAELPRHAIEGPSEVAEFVVAARCLDLHVEIAGAHLLGRADEIADRSNDAGRKGEAEPYRDHQQQQCDDDEKERKGDLDAGTLAFELLIGSDRAAVALDLRDHARIDEAPDIEKAVDKAVEAHDRANPVIGIAGEEDDLTCRRLVERRLRYGAKLERETQARARDDPPRACEHDRLSERTQIGLS